MDLEIHMHSIQRLCRNQILHQIGRFKPEKPEIPQSQPSGLPVQLVQTAHETLDTHEVHPWMILCPSGQKRAIAAAQLKLDTLRPFEQAIPIEWVDEVCRPMNNRRGRSAIHSDQTFPS